jgi:two-component system, chemotaxis family, CheB/CheR fusion protein
MEVQDRGVDKGKDRGSAQESEKRPCPVVGMGASAGGLEAFRAFFERMPADTGMVFVIVQHLDPQHDTLMPELLARHTSMPVSLVTRDTPLTSNAIFVLPPHFTLTVDDCVLRVSRPDRTRGRRAPIDSFFRSLAEDQGDDAVGVVFSGTGTDGALGLKAIKEHGGMTLVQAPSSARYDSMPRAAIVSGAAEHVLPVEEMPAHLIEHVRRLTTLRGGDGIEGPRQEVESLLGKIAMLLRNKTGHDFSRYKRSTLVRRIRRRLIERQAGSAMEYLETLQREPHEIDQLFRDLLIGVTDFFRDPESFAVLARKVMPKLFETKEADSQVRVWVPGCATGEEAYSLAILLREHALRLPEPPHILVFATDIDAQALETARQAWYPERIAEQVSPERLERFFVRHGNLYQVSKEIRELCLFSSHNVITDPPFSRLDLISCRNLLIYLESDLQKKLIPLFHYALRSGGFLFLGPSESVAGWPDLYRTIDKRHRVYQCKDVVLRPPVSFPLTERFRFSVPRPFNESPPAANGEQGVARAFERVLLENYSPACVLVNERGEVLYFSPRTGKYLEPPGGTPTLRVLELARQGLRLDLRTALHKAMTSRAAVTHENVTFESDGAVHRVDLTARPMFELGEDAGLFMIVFQERERSGAGTFVPEPAEGREAPAEASGVIRRLESELRITKDHLQATLEELESSNEELISSNEELLSINEELQSANEELQTSKEELQSVNEELETINTELKKKVEELDGLNSDLVNLFQSTRIATVFMDRDLRIKKFTPAATEVFRLIEEDVGRSIADIAPRFAADGLITDIKAVLRTLAAREWQVRLIDEDAWYILRILPYRTLDNVIDGVVLTFVDITELRRAQEQRDQLARIVESSQDAILSKTLDGVVTSWNAGAERMYGYTAREMIGHPVEVLAPPERRAELIPIFERLRRGLRIEPFETVRVRKDGRRLSVILTISPVFGFDGQVMGASAIARDITDSKRAEEELRLGEERYRSLVQALTSVVWTADAEGRFVERQTSWEEYTGQSWEEHAGWGWAQAVYPEDRERIKALWSESLARRTPYRAEGRIWNAASAAYRHFAARAVPLLDADRAVREWVGTVNDVEDRKQAENALREAGRRKDEFLAMLGHELRNPLAPIRNCLYVLSMPNATATQTQRALATLERQVLHLTRLVDDLLDVSRISQGKILLRNERLDLVELVRSTVEDHRGALTAAGLALEVELPAGPLWVSGDPTRLSQSIGNVLHNALKFTDHGGRVRVRAGSADGSAVVAIEDNGIGIEPEVLGRLFEPFSQAPPGIDRRRGGLGLGLALVRRLLELHGGTVEASSGGSGRGTEIRLRLPVVEAPAASPEDGGAPPAGQPRRCLIIEDNVDAAESMALLLQLKGHEVAVAHTGQEGLETARRFRPHVVFCDIGLPGALDGYAVARAIRDDPDFRFVRLIALTGYGQEDDQRRAREAGFDLHLTKPADPEMLQALLAG